MIEVRGLSKRYGDTVAVDDLTFRVEPGTVTGFLGPNGAGKSTTMRMVLGLDRPSAGCALVDGRQVADSRQPLREVGALLDPGALHPGRSGRDHLRVAARANGLPRQRVEAVLEQVGLEGVARRRVKGYSLGMRQRLGIAAALLGDPGVLLFDEPVNGLDLDGVRWIRALLRRLADEGRTVLVSSHLMSEVQLTADRLVVIGRGRLLVDATTAEVVRGLGGVRVEVRSPRAAALAAVLEQRGFDVERVGEHELQVLGATADEVGDLAFAHDVPVRHLAEVQQSLEDAYVELTTGSVEHRGGPDPARVAAGASA